MVQTDLAEKKEKKKIIWLSKNRPHMAEVFLIPINVFMWSGPGCVNQYHKDTMKGKKISSCVVMKSTLQDLRDGLLEKGHDLQDLLKADFPDTDAVFVAVESIILLLQDHPVDISDQWVTAHVIVGDEKKFVSNLPVREVSILSLFLHLLCLICCIINLSFA